MTLSLVIGFRVFSGLGGHLCCQLMPSPVLSMMPTTPKRSSSLSPRTARLRRVRTQLVLFRITRSPWPPSWRTPWGWEMVRSGTAPPYSPSTRTWWPRPRTSAFALTRRMRRRVRLRHRLRSSQREGVQEAEEHIQFCKDPVKFGFVRTQYKLGFLRSQ